MIYTFYLILYILFYMYTIHSIQYTSICSKNNLVIWFFKLQERNSAKCPILKNTVNPFKKTYSQKEKVKICTQLNAGLTPLQNPFIQCFIKGHKNQWNAQNIFGTRLFLSSSVWFLSFPQVQVNGPSWCDRVLWKSYPESHITCTSYGRLFSGTSQLLQLKLWRSFVSFLNTDFKTIVYHKNEFIFPIISIVISLATLYIFPLCA